MKATWIFGAPFVYFFLKASSSFSHFLHPDLKQSWKAMEQAPISENLPSADEDGQAQAKDKCSILHNITEDKALRSIAAGLLGTSDGKVSIETHSREAVSMEEICKNSDEINKSDPSSKEDYRNVNSLREKLSESSAVGTEDENIEAVEVVDEEPVIKDEKTDNQIDGFPFKGADLQSNKINGKNLEKEPSEQKEPQYDPEDVFVSAYKDISGISNDEVNIKGIPETNSLLYEEHNLQVVEDTQNMDKILEKEEKVNEEHVAEPVIPVVEESSLQQNDPEGEQLEDCSHKSEDKYLEVFERRYERDKATVDAASATHLTEDTPLVIEGKSMGKVQEVPVNDKEIWQGNVHGHNEAIDQLTEDDMPDVSDSQAENDLKGGEAKKEDSKETMENVSDNKHDIAEITIHNDENSSDSTETTEHSEMESGEGPPPVLSEEKLVPIGGETESAILESLLDTIPQKQEESRGITNPENEDANKEEYVTSVEQSNQDARKNEIEKVAADLMHGHKLRASKDSEEDSSNENEPANKTNEDNSDEKVGELLVAPQMVDENVQAREEMKGGATESINESLVYDVGDNVDQMAQVTDTENHEKASESESQNLSLKSDANTEATAIDTLVDGVSMEKIIAAACTTEASTRDNERVEPDEPEEKYSTSNNENEGIDKHTQGVLQVIAEKEATRSEDNGSMKNSIFEDQQTEEVAEGMNLHMEQMEGENLYKGYEQKQKKDLHELAEDSMIYQDQSSTEEAPDHSQKKAKLDEEHEYGPGSAPIKIIEAEETAAEFVEGGEHLEKQESSERGDIDVIIEEATTETDAEEESCRPEGEIKETTKENDTDNLNEVADKNHEKAPNNAYEEQIHETMETEDSIKGDGHSEKTTQKVELASESAPKQKIQESNTTNDLSKNEPVIEKNESSSMNIGSSCVEHELEESKNDEGRVMHGSASKELNGNDTDNIDLIEQNTETENFAKKMSRSVMEVNSHDTVDTSGEGAKVEPEEYIHERIEENRSVESTDLQEEKKAEAIAINSYEEMENEELNKRIEPEQGNESGQLPIDGDIFLEENRDGNTLDGVLKGDERRTRLENSSDECSDKVIVAKESATTKEVEQKDASENDEESFQDNHEVDVILKQAAVVMDIEHQSCIPEEPHQEIQEIFEPNIEAENEKDEEKVHEGIVDNPNDHALIEETRDDAIGEKYEEPSTVCEDQNHQTSTAKENIETDVCEEQKETEQLQVITESLYEDKNQEATVESEAIKIDSPVYKDRPNKLTPEISSLSNDTEIAKEEDKENIEKNIDGHAMAVQTIPYACNEEHEEAFESVSEKLINQTFTGEDCIEADFQKDKTDTEKPKINSNSLPSEHGKEASGEFEASRIHNSPSDNNNLDKSIPETIVHNEEPEPANVDEDILEKDLDDTLATHLLVGETNKDFSSSYKDNIPALTEKTRQEEQICEGSITSSANELHILNENKTEKLEIGNASMPNEENQREITGAGVALLEGDEHGHEEKEMTESIAVQLLEETKMNDGEASRSSMQSQGIEGDEPNKVYRLVYEKKLEKLEPEKTQDEEMLAKEEASDASFVITTSMELEKPSMAAEVEHLSLQSIEKLEAVKGTCKEAEDNDLASHESSKTMDNSPTTREASFEGNMQKETSSEVFEGQSLNVPEENDTLEHEALLIENKEEHQSKAIEEAEDEKQEQEDETQTTNITYEAIVTNKEGSLEAMENTESGLVKEKSDDPELANPIHGVPRGTETDDVNEHRSKKHSMHENIEENIQKSGERILEEATVELEANNQTNETISSLAENAILHVENHREITEAGVALLEGDKHDKGKEMTKSIEAIQFQETKISDGDASRSSMQSQGMEGDELNKACGLVCEQMLGKSELEKKQAEEMLGKEEALDACFMISTNMGLEQSPMASEVEHSSLRSIEKLEAVKGTDEEAKHNDLISHESSKTMDNSTSAREASVEGNLQKETSLEVSEVKMFNVLEENNTIKHDSLMIEDKEEHQSKQIEVAEDEKQEEKEHVEKQDEEILAKEEALDACFLISTNIGLQQPSMAAEVEHSSPQSIEKLELVKGTHEEAKDNDLISHESSMSTREASVEGNLQKETSLEVSEGQMFNVLEENNTITHDSLMIENKEQHQSKQIEAEDKKQEEEDETQIRNIASETIVPSKKGSSEEIGNTENGLVKEQLDGPKIANPMYEVPREPETNDIKEDRSEKDYVHENIEDNFQKNGEYTLEEATVELESSNQTTEAISDLAENAILHEETHREVTGAGVALLEGNKHCHERKEITESIAVKLLEETKINDRDASRSSMQSQGMDGDELTSDYGLIDEEKLEKPELEKKQDGEMLTKEDALDACFMIPTNTELEKPSMAAEVEHPSLGCIEEMEAVKGTYEEAKDNDLLSHQSTITMDNATSTREASVEKNMQTEISLEISEGQIFNIPEENNTIEHDALMIKNKEHRSKPIEEVEDEKQEEGDETQTTNTAAEKTITNKKGSSEEMENTESGLAKEKVDDPELSIPIHVVPSGPETDEENEDKSEKHGVHEIDVQKNGERMLGEATVELESSNHANEIMKTGNVSGNAESKEATDQENQSKMVNDLPVCNKLFDKITEADGSDAHIQTESIEIDTLNKADKKLQTTVTGNEEVPEKSEMLNVRSQNDAEEVMQFGEPSNTEPHGIEMAESEIIEKITAEEDVLGTPDSMQVKDETITENFKEDEDEATNKKPDENWEPEQADRIPNNEAKESDYQPSEDNILMTHSCEKKDMALQMEEITSKQYLDTSAEKMAAEKTKQDTHENLNEVSLSVPEAISINAVVREHAKEGTNDATGPTELTEHTSAESESVDEIVKEKEATDGTSRMSPVTEETGKDATEQEDRDKLEEASDMVTNEIAEKVNSSLKVTEEDENSKKQSAMLEPEVSLEAGEASYKIAQIDTQNEGKHLDVLPVSQFLLNHILRDEGDMPDKACDMESEDKIEKGKYDNQNAVDFPEPEQIITPLPAEQATEGATASKDTGSFEKLENASDLVEEREVNNLKENIKDVIGKDDGSRQSNRHDLPPEKLDGEDGKYKVPCSSSELSAHAATSHSTELTSAEQKIHINELYVEQYMYSDMDKEEKILGTVLDSEIVEQEIEKASETLTKDADVSPFLEASEEDVLQKESHEKSKEIPQDAENIDKGSSEASRKQSPSVFEPIQKGSETVNKDADISPFTKASEEDVLQIEGHEVSQEITQDVKKIDKASNEVFREQSPSVFESIQKGSETLNKDADVSRFTKASEEDVLQIEGHEESKEIPDDVLDVELIKQEIKKDSENPNEDAAVSPFTKASDDACLNKKGHEEGKELLQDVEKIDESSYEVSREQSPSVSEPIQDTESLVYTEKTPSITGKSSEANVFEDSNLGETQETVSEVDRVESGEGQDENTGNRVQNVKNDSTEELKLPESQKVQQSDLVMEATKETLETAENILEERSTAESTNQKQTKDITGSQLDDDKTDEEKDEKDANECKIKESELEAAVIVEARDADLKPTNKKSHSILSGVGSKVKHSISKVKKAITGKSSHSKTQSTK